MQTDIQTDGRSDSFLVAGPRCMQCMQRNKMWFVRKKMEGADPHLKYSDLENKNVEAVRNLSFS